MKFNSLKEKLSIVISGLITLVLLIVLIGYNSVLKEQTKNAANQLIINNYIKYSSILQKEINSIKAKNDLLSIVISKTYANSTIDELEKIIRPLVNNNPEIYKITYAYFTEKKPEQDTAIGSNGYLKTEYLTIKKTLKGTQKITSAPDDNLKLEIFKKDLMNKEGSSVFEVQEHQPFNYVPVLTPVFSGKKYLGYIETSISTDRINELFIKISKQTPKTIKVYLSANNKIIAANSKEMILGEPLKTVCPACLVKKEVDNGSGYFTVNNEMIYCADVLPEEEAAGDFKICFVASQEEVYSSLGYNWWKNSLPGIVLWILSIALIYFITGYITAPFKQLIGFAEKVALGDFECEQKDMEITRKDEIGQLQKAFRAISFSLKETAEVSNAIASGDFSKSLKPKSNNDLLAFAINKMRDALEKKKHESEENKEEEEKQKWINKGLGLISDVLKKNQDDTQNLTGKLIKTLVEYLDVALGGVYMKETDSEGNDVYRMVAAYAYSEQRYVDRKFYQGESLVGSCVSEQRVIYMSNIPEGYITVLSGIGESAPKSLILIPLKYNDEVFGVLELASLREFSEKEQEFLKNAADNIASTLSLTQISLQTGLLLEKTKKQARELEIRDKEMKLTLQKISDLQEETARKEAEMRAKITALNNSLMIVEYTVEGVLFDANEKFLNTMGYGIKELKGRNVLDLLTEAERRELLHIIDTVKQGNFYETIVRRHTKHGKEKWLVATYTPVLTDEGSVNSILFYATDVTRMVKKEQSLFAQISDLKSELHDLLKEKYHLETDLSKQKSKNEELILQQKNVENDLLQKIEELKNENVQKIKDYEQMIREIISDWETHINAAEKLIRGEDNDDV